MGFVYAIANQKGGVGKTTTTVNLAACIAEAGRQTLVVVLDPQCNATVTLGLDRSEYRLRDGLGPIRERFAATFVDCPPSLGPITVNALAAADRVIVPVQAEYLALEGLVQFLDTLQSVRRQLNPALVLTGIAITMTDDRTRLSQDVEHELKDHFTDLVLETVVPRSVRLAEAPSFGVPVIAHAPESRGAVAYRSLAEEVMARG